MQKFSIGFIIIIALSVGSSSFANDDLKIKKEYTSHKDIKDVNFDLNEFYEHHKLVKEKIEEAFEEYHEKQNIIIQYTYHKNEDPSIVLFTSLEKDEKELQRIMDIILAVDPINSKIVDYHMLYKIKIDGGKGKNVKYYPVYKTPDELLDISIDEADFEDKIKIIKDWSINDILPVYVALLLDVNENSTGALDYARLIHDTNFNSEQDIDELTEGNADFWWAYIESPAWNQLIGGMKVFMHLSQGEFDEARLYKNVVSIFDGEESLIESHLESLNNKFDFFYEELNDWIEEGTDLHDDEDYEGAIDIYVEILEIYPKSAWANYELYLSKTRMKIDNGDIDESDRDGWDVAKSDIYGSNPMYGIAVRADNGKEGYMMLRRMAINSVYEGDDFVAGLLSYGDIGLDLEVYGFAGLMYWNILDHVTEKKHKRKKLIYYYLYCLEKLGVTEVKRIAKGATAKEFSKIEKSRLKLMKKSKIYKLFKDGDHSIVFN